MVLRAGLHGTVGQSSAQVIDGSLKFSGDSHLTRTPSSGNQRTYTFSFWAKPCDISSNTNYFFTAGTSNPGGINNMALNFDSVNRLVFGGYKASDYDVENTAAYHRDTGWYHFVAAVDTTQSVPADRVKFYVNGIEQSKPTSGSPFGLDSTPFFNSNVLHTIGSSALSDYSGYMSQVYFIDGQALGPENFGYTDALTNTWRPKKFSGEYYLPQDGTIFSDFLSSTGGVEYAENAFDGSISSQEALGNTTNEPLVLDFSSLNLSGTLRVYVPAVSTGCTLRANVNGGSFVTASDNTAQWIDLGTVADIDEIRIQITNTNPLNFRVGLRAVEVNGSILVNGTPAQGTNSFYLPMDGNSPIGEDKSGRGNNWTPVNFGGSNTLEKATGALPILNTVNGGNVATAGVRTDSAVGAAATCILALPLVGIKSDFSNKVDSRSTEKVITANGNAAASSTQSNFYGGSFYFDGTGDYLSVPTDADFGFGTDDYTIEYWYYNSKATGAETFIWDTRDGTNNQPTVYYNTSGHLNFYFNGSNRITISDTSLWGQNRWQHHAFVRNGTSIKFYADGFERGSVTGSFTHESTAKLVIGASNAGTAPINGYIQDFRVYKGTAKYTSNFIPASTNPDIFPDTPSGVSGSSKLTKITDGAVAFDGTGDYLQIPDSDDWNMGTGDFTMEAYIYLNTASADYDAIFTKFASGQGQFWWVINNSGQQVFYYYHNGGASSVVATGGSIATKRWYHVAVVRNGNTLYVYQDGVQVTTADLSSAGAMNDSTAAAHIGASGGAGYWFDGFISNLRCIKGTALYTSNFTPPSAPLTNVTNTKLLCCQSNASAVAVDVSPNISGINDGTVWSANFTSSSNFNSSYPPSKAFDGSDSTYAEPVNAGSTMTVTFDPPLVVSGDFEVKIGSSGELFTTINGGSSTSQGSGLTQYHTLGSNITVSNFTYTSSTKPVLYAVRVNGSTFLTDPVTVNGNASATNFNPFTTDINTVRGQESGYATLNPLATQKSGDVTLSNGNLTATLGTSRTSVYANLPFVGKMYYEVTFKVAAYVFGMAPSVDFNTTAGTLPQRFIGDSSGSYGAGNDGTVYNNAVSNYDGSLSSTYGVGDCMGWAYDSDSGKFSVYKNGVYQGTFTASTSRTYYPAITLNGTGAGVDANFGQKPFKFPPPDGFQPLNAANVRPSTVIARPDQYVGIATYTGNGGTQSISSLNLQPDLVWIKDRDGTNNHMLYDSVRGSDGKNLIPNSTAIEGAAGSNDLTGYTSNGFTLGSNNAVNINNVKFVSWCWKAGGNSNTFNVDGRGYASAAAAGLTAGTITPTGASVGTKQGFSIIKWTAPSPQDNNATVPHGLTQKPDFWAVKSLDGARDWICYTEQIDGTLDFIHFNNREGKADSSANAPTATTFSVYGNDINTAGENQIAYLWHDVPGLQKFGTFTGNGSTDGSFIELGFKPALIIYRCTSVAGDWWNMIDTERSTYNPLGPYIELGDAARAEQSAALVDMLSNGFKLRFGTGNQWNGSGQTYVYAAWAEAPSFNLYGAQSNAR